MPRPRHFRGIDAAAPLKPGGAAPSPPPSAPFPRHRCRGPIEAGFQALQSFWGCHFRGIDAAAPLKPDSRRDQDSGRAGFPRHRCRGPIEAVGTPVVPTHPHRAFPRHRCRGPIEAIKEPALRTYNSRFPRHRCRGPIEAPFNRGIIYLTTLNFRGIDAAAPLKHVPGHPGHRNHLDFRGIDAAAPLKPCLCQDLGHARLTISAASMPRPH